MSVYKGSGCLSVLVVVILISSTIALLAHDHRYAVTPQQDKWFKSLKTERGRQCCGGPTVDGKVLTELDWESIDGHYRVRIDGKWIDVPDDAVLKQPNMYGPTMVWPTYVNGAILIHCFIPGMMT